MLLIIVVVPVLLNLVLLSHHTSALEYSSNTNIQFTFNPVLSMNVSGDLVIYDLQPGTASDSNVINVNVATNNVTGYNLSATVGDNDNPTTNLVHTDNHEHAFTNLTASVSNPTDFDPNTWGYSYSTDNSTTWHDYANLPLYTSTTGATINTTTSPGNDSIKFKIAARADNAQTAGTYTNVINFYAVTNQSPTSFYDAFAAAGKEQYNGYYKMQDMSDSICSAVTTAGADSITTLIDVRDNKLYTIAKQADGKCWMTQNLDLEIATDATSGITGAKNPTTGAVTSLTSENTNLAASGSGAYVDGYSVSDNVITWTPVSGATTSSHIISETSVSPAFTTSDYTIPQSAEAGDTYVYTSNSDSDDAVYDSLSACTAAVHTEAECAHYHVGNYYNWTIAIASNASGGISTGGDTAANSICPAGWRLPKGRASSDTSATREFGYLFQQSGVTSSLTATSYASGGFNKIRTNPLFFVRGGIVDGSSLGYRASNGTYWSSTVGNSDYADRAYFYRSGINSAYGSYRYFGFSVRCVAQ